MSAQSRLQMVSDAQTGWTGIEVSIAANGQHPMYPGAHKDLRCGCAVLAWQDCVHFPHGLETA